jgi:hypothetical protein
MPITTFLNDLEKKTFVAVSDKELNELFQEVRKIDNRFLLQERVVVYRRFLRKPIISTVYTLYFDYLAPKSNWDIQIISLGENDIFGSGSNKNLVCAYFYGFLSGKD